MMTKAEQLRAMAAWFRQKGRRFTPEYGDEDTCACFIGARFAIGGPHPVYSTPLGTIVGSFNEEALRSDGWTKRDAIAACEIAADLAS